jgi:glycosyl transferase family 25
MQSFQFTETNTFCISLLSLPERWTNMEKRFDQMGIKVTRWTASTPDNITDNFVGYLSIYQKACAQSHLNIYRYMIDNNIEYALIMEDDACFDKNWKEKLNTYTNTVRDSEWDAIFLNSSEIENPIHTWNICNDQYLTGAYIIHRRGIQYIMNRFHPCYCSSDWMTSRLQENRHSYSYFPWLVIQEGESSTIGSGVKEDHAKVVRCLNDINYSLDNYIDAKSI